MKRIFKYQLDITDYQEIMLPRGARILSVQAQNDVPCLWAIVDEYEVMTTISILMFGTGHPISYDYEVENYLGTFQLMQGTLVFHVFKI